MKRAVFVVLITVLFVAFSQPVFAQELPVSDPSAKPNVVVADTDSRPALLRAYLQTRHSPFADDAGHFIHEADRLHLDWKLVAAISGVESTFGQHIPTGSYNAWGWGVFTGTNDGIHFTDWKDGVTQVSEGLRYHYMAKGAKTVDEIGRIYAASPTWAYKVKWFIADIESFHPKSPKALAVTI